MHRYAHPLTNGGDAARDLPLLKTPEGTRLAWRRPGIRGMCAGICEIAFKEVSNMPSAEKRQPKIARTCGACELALADGKATLHMLCGFEDCRQALQWGYKNGGTKPTPLPRIYYMRSDIIDVKGRDKMVVVKLREDGAVRRVYCTHCYSILGHVHAIFNNNVFGNFVEIA
jgi:hypothetical protein